jgi:hypothetical protein
MLVKKKTTKAKFGWSSGPSKTKNVKPNAYKNHQVSQNYVEKLLSSRTSGTTNACCAASMLNLGIVLSIKFDGVLFHSQPPARHIKELVCSHQRRNRAGL